MGAVSDKWHKVLIVYKLYSETTSYFYEFVSHFKKESIFKKFLRGPVETEAFQNYKGERPFNVQTK